MKVVRGWRAGGNWGSAGTYRGALVQRVDNRIDLIDIVNIDIIVGSEG